MGKIAVAALLLALAFLMPFAHAEVAASFASGVATLPKGVKEDGHYGNYTLVAQNADGKVRVSVSGPDESPLVLLSELFWLQQNSGFSTLCSFEGVTSHPAGQEAYCDENGSWVSATGAALPPPAESVAAIADRKAQSFAATGAAGHEPAPAPLAAPQANGGISGEQTLQLLGAFLAVIVASYLILQSRQAPPLDAAAEKLLSNPTRAGIMEELSSADKIPTDISAKLGKSKAAVIEHLGALSDAGLVERVATPGKKFVYYRLTQKGRQTLLKRAG